MAKVNYTKHTVGTPVAGEVVECETTSCDAAPEQSTAVATRPVSAPVSKAAPTFDDENIGFEDIRLPSLIFVHGVGEMAKSYNPGEIVLAQNEVLLLHTPSNAAKRVVGDPPLVIIPLGFRKRRYVEKLEGGARGRMVNSEEAVAEVGGTLDYAEWKANKKMPLFQALATGLFLIERPEKIKDEENLTFPYEVNGKHYTLALWSMKGTAYTNGAKHFFTAKKIGPLKAGGYRSHSWTLTTAIKAAGEQFVNAPVVRISGKNSPEMLALIADICDGN